ncbi:aminotransferase class I/II-fold pyridoxal phosphate-dependent enzyme [Vibrio sp. CAIM 722]|uniref:Aminotransferase n=1 Tax=Vibrio eleionomae TaxID=2653505 RepID=A0A7X4LJ41_9VIBR|nr:pyridoxal phosphate-dependent aminotransferase [Vibrio eleionomae]MZI92895.1 aminotransferase class I/II-fold pyridoxal phosphate-dependent enzyme [Vibrio eleionomae]
MQQHIKAPFHNVTGGLFDSVIKADVGEGAGKIIESGGTILAWADPDFPDPAMPASVQQALIDSVNHGVSSHYVMPIGPRELRVAIADKIQRQTGLDLDPSRNIIVTPGSDSGLFYAMYPFLESGDEVLVPTPTYPNNMVNISLMGAKAIEVPTQAENNYQIEKSQLEKHLTPNTKMLVICHPNNPTSVVYRKEVIADIAEFVIENDLILICDQAFEDIIFDGIEFVAPASLPQMLERTVTVCSMSKGYGLSGLRIGYIYTSDTLIDKYYGAAVNILGAPSHLSCAGAIAALHDDTIINERQVRLANRRATVCEIFNSIQGVSCQAPESGILQWINVENIGNGADITQFILQDQNVLVNPGGQYGKGFEGYLRLIYGCFRDDVQLFNACERVKDGLINFK